MKPKTSTTQELTESERRGLLSGVMARRGKLSYSRVAEAMGYDLDRVRRELADAEAALEAAIGCPLEGVTYAELDDWAASGRWPRRG